jgi:O-succinylbenzoate synthase
LSPSVRCGIETAMLNLTAAATGKPMARLLAERPLETIRVNALVVDDANVTEAVRRLKREGYRAVKLKVGRRSLDDDIARTRDAFHELGGDTSLRLDANRAWTYEQALGFAAAIEDCTIEYIEEPLTEPKRTQEFAEESGLPVALDESLGSMKPEQLARSPFLSAIVLKPTLLGGLERAAGLARAARVNRTKVVISSCFESSVGIAALIQFTAAFGSLNSPDSQLVLP